MNNTAKTRIAQSPLIAAKTTRANAACIDNTAYGIFSAMVLRLSEKIKKIAAVDANSIPFFANHFNVLTGTGFSASNIRGKASNKALKSSFETTK